MSMSNVEWYAPGDVIQPYCLPLIKFLYCQERESRCSYCFQKVEGLRCCAGCRKAFYCDKSCQKRDWKMVHSLECKSPLFECQANTKIDGQIIDPDMILKILKTLFMLRLHPELTTKPHQMWYGKSKCYNDLMTHEAECEKDDGYKTIANIMAGQLNVRNGGGGEGTTGQGVDVNPKDLLRIIGIWKTNSFQIVDDTSSPVVAVGAGIYIQTSFFDHSCRPNAVRVSSFPSCAVEMRCIDPIKRGQKPFVTYLTGVGTLEDRQKILKDRYHFTCDCDLCRAERFGPATNYELLEQIVKPAGAAASLEDMPWEMIYNSRDDALNLFRYLFHEYDERITNYCICICEGLLMRNQKYGNIPSNILNEVMADTENRIKITFGTEHEEYMKFAENKLGFMNDDGTFTFERVKID